MLLILRLDRDVYADTWLVVPHQGGIDREGPAMPIVGAWAAFLGVRKRVRAARRQADHVDRLSHASALRCGRLHAVDDQRLGDDVADHHAGMVDA